MWPAQTLLPDGHRFETTTTRSNLHPLFRPQPQTDKSALCGEASAFPSAAFFKMHTLRCLYCLFKMQEMSRLQFMEKINGLGKI